MVPEIIYSNPYISQINPWKIMWFIQSSKLSDKTRLLSIFPISFSKVLFFNIFIKASCLPTPHQPKSYGKCYSFCQIRSRCPSNSERLNISESVEECEQNKSRRMEQHVGRYGRGPEHSFFEQLYVAHRAEGSGTCAIEVFLCSVVGKS